MSAPSRRQKRTWKRRLSRVRYSRNLTRWTDYWIASGTIQIIRDADPLDEPSAVILPPWRRT